MMKTETGTRHLAYLDGLRGAAALYVLLHHALYQISGSSPHSIIENSDGESLAVKLAATIFRQGRLSVDIFIVLSGFCLMLPVIKNGALAGGIVHFFYKRARRILPPYYFALGFALLLISTLIGDKSGTHWDVSIPVGQSDIITHLLLVHDFFISTAFKINHVMWSVAVEWRIYFLFPVFLFLRKKIGSFYTTLTAVVGSFFLYFLMAWLDSFWGLKLNPATISMNYIGLFAMGMLAAEVAFSETLHFIAIRRKLPLRTAFFIAPVIVVILQKTGPFHNFHITLVLIDLLIGIFTVALLIGTSCGRMNLIHQLLSWKPLAFLGLFAYSIYLTHAPLLQVFTKYVAAPSGLTALPLVLLYIFIAGPLVLLVSYLFFLVAEKPFLRRK